MKATSGLPFTGLLDRFLIGQPFRVEAFCSLDDGRRKVLQTVVSDGEVADFLQVGDGENRNRDYFNGADDFARETTGQFRIVTFNPDGFR